MEKFKTMYFTFTSKHDVIKFKSFLANDDEMIKKGMNSSDLWISDFTFEIGYFNLNDDNQYEMFYDIIAIIETFLYDNNIKWKNEYSNCFFFMGELTSQIKFEIWNGGYWM